jgi:hypothetical protein
MAKSITLMVMYNIVLGLHLRGGIVNYSPIDLLTCAGVNYFLELLNK